MRNMPNPVQNGGAIFTLCVNSIANLTLKTNFNAVAASINISCLDYLTKGGTGNLYQIPPDYSTNDAIYLGVATKKDFKNVYTQQMVGEDKPGRLVYDILLASAPGGKCPLCGFAQATTLDHYLPKAKFPQFSVFPSNLVPACGPCNFGKRAELALTRGGQSIHPYFDAALIGEQWLFADVVPGNPLTIRYFTNPPVDWLHDEKERVESHFVLLDLREKYSTEASDELANIRDTILRYTANLGAAIISADLLATSNDRFKIHKNSWQTALYQALGQSVWYCQGGYLCV